MADYSDLIKKYSAKYGVPEKLIQQVINVESSGKADAVSKTGPVGLMQVSSAVAKEAGYSKSDMYDPEKNIDAGVKYLASNLKAFKGNVPNALLGYNQGTGGARQMLAGKKPMAQEGYNYMRNKKFSPEYIAQDATVPMPTQAPASTEVVNLGKEGVQKPEPEKYSSASLMTQAPQQPSQPQPLQPQQQQQPQQPAEQKPKELTDAEKINMFATKLRGLFDNAATYQNTNANTVKRNFMDEVFNTPNMQNAAALFGGFK